MLGVNDQHVSSSEISAQLLSEGAGRAFDLSFNSSGATQTDVAKPNIFGSEFSDALNGDSSRNIIFGDGGNYTINGGDGNDWLCGDGSDTFHFNAVNDALAGLVATISDFELTIDDIDLAIDANGRTTGDQAFSFAGQDTGSLAVSSKQNAVWFSQANGNTAVFADNSGDGVADLEIQLPGLKNLNSGDFIL